MAKKKESYFVRSGKWTCKMCGEEGVVEQGAVSPLEDQAELLCIRQHEEMSHDCTGYIFITIIVIELDK